MLANSVDEISSQIIAEEKQKEHAQRKLAAKKQRQNVRQVSRDRSSEDSDASVEEVNVLERLTKIEFSVDSSCRSEESDAVDSRPAQGGPASESIWANAADIFNPAKRATFLAKTEQKKPPASTKAEKAPT